MFCDKEENLPPGRRRYPVPNAGSPDPWQHWPFRGVRACRGVRGPNSHRVTRGKLHDVRGGHSNQAFAGMNGPIRLRQHGTFLALFTNIWLGEPNVRE